MDVPRDHPPSANWKIIRGRLKEWWGILTDDELDQLRGRREQLEGHIQKRTGQDRAVVQERMNELEREFKTWD
jgi:uncharacterized protein YjbJ (UPF0337 family)